jgi:hypothetical protein
MSSTKVKLQLGDKIKMLVRKPYQSADELTQAVVKTYPKRLANKQIKLKYQDEEGEWLYISDDNDTASFNEYAAAQGNKNVKLVIDVVGAKAPEAVQAEGAEKKQEVLKEDKKEEIKHEDLKDFKINDALLEIEKLFNSEEKFGPMRIFKVFKDAAEGTKAQTHMERLAKIMRQRFAKGKGCSRSPSGKKGHRGKHWRKHQEVSSSEERVAECPQFMPPICYGPMGPNLFHGHGGRSHRPGKHFRHGSHHKDKKAMRFFKKFMQQYRDKSTTSSSEEAEATSKPVISNVPETTEQS